MSGAPAYLNKFLPFDPWVLPGGGRLPGTHPLAPDDWLWVRENYAAQMAERERLIAREGAAVCRLAPEATAAAQELLDVVLKTLAQMPGFEVSPLAVRRPDTKMILLNRDAPLQTLGHLCQEDFCLLQPGPDGGYCLTGAILCFPASWTLSDKFQRPLTAIHAPVAAYTGDVAARVARLFQGIKPGRGLWRANVLPYDHPQLFMPTPRTADAPGAVAQFLRSERQCLQRLPETGAVVFSIHTFLLNVNDLTEDQRAGFAACLA